MNETILLIEPDPERRKKVAEGLPGSALVKATGEEALRKAVDAQPDVILVGLALPAAAGFEVVAQLQAHRETREIPILFLAEPAETRAVGVDHRADRIVSPDDADALQAAVEAAAREARVTRAIKQAIASVDASLREASDLTEAEIAALRTGGFDPDATIDFEPLASREHRYARLLASSLTVAQAAGRLGVTPGRVRQRLKEGSLYGVQKRNEWRLPLFQFEDADLVPNLEHVIARLDRALDPVTVEGWFVRPHPDLEGDDDGLSPRDWLAQGRPWEPVAELAEDL